MATLNGKQYSNPKNINLKGGILRFGATQASNPVSATSNALYYNASNQLVASSQGVTSLVTMGFQGTETIAAGGTSTALSLAVSQHLISCDAGGDTFTLAAGTVGQIMTIVAIAVNAGTATITPATLIGGTSITFNAIGDTVVLQYTASGWIILGGNSYGVS